MRAYVNDPEWRNRKLDGYGAEDPETGTVPGAANDYTVELNERIVKNGTLAITCNGDTLTVVPYGVDPAADQAAVSYDLPLVKVHSSREGQTLSVDYVRGGGVLSSARYTSIPKGDPGEGVPTGGTTGQMLAKIDETDYNTEWVDPPAGGGGAVDSVNGQTGEVVLAAHHINYDAGSETVDQSLSNLYGITTQLDIDKASLSATSNTFSGDMEVEGDLTAGSLQIGDVSGGDSSFQMGANGLVTHEDGPGLSVFDFAGDIEAEQITASAGFVGGGAGITGIPTLTTALGTVNHGATASTARPSGYTYVQWVGSVEPENAMDGDSWLDTSGA